MAQFHPAELTTARLHMRCASTADPDALAAAVNDFEIARWLTRVPYSYARVDAEDYILRLVDQPKLVWAIHDTEGFAGIIGFDNDLGYWLARRTWARGYATEAARAALDVWFADPTLEEVHSSYFEGNEASARVLEKMGFRDGGPRLLPSVSNGRDMVARKMRLTRTDWQAARS